MDLRQNHCVHGRGRRETRSTAPARGVRLARCCFTSWRKAEDWTARMIVPTCWCLCRDGGGGDSVEDLIRPNVWPKAYQPFLGGAFARPWFVFSGGEWPGRLGPSGINQPGICFVSATAESVNFRNSATYGLLTMCLRVGSPAVRPLESFARFVLLGSIWLWPTSGTEGPVKSGQKSSKDVRSPACKKS